jgi:hypothetical protein
VLSALFRYTDSDYPFAWPLCCLLFFDIQILITSLRYTDSDYLPSIYGFWLPPFDIRILITSLRYTDSDYLPSIYRFWLPLWYLHTLLIFIAWKHFWLYPYMYVLLFLIVSVLASSVVDRKFELRSAPTNDYKTGTCCFSCRHLTHIITSHRNTTCSRTDIAVKNCSFGGKQQTFTLIPLLLMTIWYNCKELLVWW